MLVPDSLRTWRALLASGLRGGLRRGCLRRGCEVGRPHREASVGGSCPRAAPAASGGAPRHGLPRAADESGGPRAVRRRGCLRQVGCGAGPRLQWRFALFLGRRALRSEPLFVMWTETGSSSLGGSLHSLSRLFSIAAVSFVPLRHLMKATCQGSPGWLASLRGSWG